MREKSSTYRALAKKYFGAGQERLVRLVLVCAVVFYGLYEAEIRMEIRPVFYFLVIWVFTAGVMWQTLFSESTMENMQNLFMLPFEKREMVFSCVEVLGLYTVVTKTLPVLAVLLAVSGGERGAGNVFIRLILGLICAAHAVLAAACVWVFQKAGSALGCLGAAPFLSYAFQGGQAGCVPIFILLLLAECAAASVLLGQGDPYAFCRQNKSAGGVKRRKKASEGHSIRRYFFRYLWTHKNYLVNSAGMCALAWLLPFLFQGMEPRFVLPLGFGLLSFQTPLCVLLSGDPALERAVHFLPGQFRAFCLPYGGFLTGAFLFTDMVFLCGWELQSGGVTGSMFLAAFCFAVLGAVLSVLLEWRFPIRGWQTESDLWHHPRKYVVPGILLLLGTILGVS